ncbi:MAG: winged helix-turn-helix domain-containing protein [Erysipelotrichaceae bacterium]|nr:winged helix-turn-helix domain-containing protein [Erysipelotrichaceae bacterium]
MLRDNPKVSVREVAKKIGLSLNGVQYHIRRINWNIHLKIGKILLRRMRKTEKYTGVVSGSTIYHC